MKTLLLTAAACLSLAACTMHEQPTAADSRLDQSGTRYEQTSTPQGVGATSRNSTAASTADRTSTRYPVGNAGGDSNPY